MFICRCITYIYIYIYIYGQPCLSDMDDSRILDRLRSEQNNTSASTYIVMILYCIISYYIISYYIVHRLPDGVRTNVVLVFIEVP